MNTVPQMKSKTICFFVCHLYFDRVKRPSSGWMAGITHHYYMITNKFENLHALQRKINTCALLPDVRPSRPILAVKRVTYIQPLRVNTVQPIGPWPFFFIPESWFFPGHSVNQLYTDILKTMVSWARKMSIYKIILISTLNSKPLMRSKMRFIIVYMYITFPKFPPPRYFPFIQIFKSLLSKRKKTWVTIFRQVNNSQSRS